MWLWRILWGFLGLIAVVVVLGASAYFYVAHQVNDYMASLEHGGGTLVRSHGLVGRFYAAKGMHHHTAVLMLGGSNGGFPYDAAAQNLADAGYPTFALAYF